MDDNLTEISRLLDSAVVEDRLQAVRLMSGVSPVPMDLFCLVFGDQDWRVRKESVRVFLSLPDVHRFTSAIIELLHDSENAGLRNSSIELLVGLGTQSVADLTEEINCPDPEVRKFVIDILGEIGGGECEEGVMNALSDEDTNVRYAAVETLGKLAVERAVNPLLDLMDDADTGLRFTILEALASIGTDVPIHRLSRYLDDRVLRKALLDCFGRIGGSDVLPSLAEGLSDPMRKVRETSLRSLGKLVLTLPTEVKTVLRDMPENLSDRLVDLLDVEDTEMQRAAIRLVAMSGVEQSARALLPLLQNDSLREDVVEAYRAYDEPFFSRLLNGALVSDPMNKLFLIYLAGELRSLSGLQLAVDSLQSSDPQQRYTAVVTLGKIGQEQSVKPLVECLKDESPEICDAAASALEMFGDDYSDAIAAAMSPFLALPDAALRMRAVRILGSVEGTSVDSALLMALKDPEPDVRCEAIKALRGSSSGTFTEGLKLALNDEVTDVRRLAAEALGACAAEHALPALSLAVEDQNPWVRAAAVRSLKSYSTNDADQMLFSLTEDSVGLVVIAALETLTERDAASARSFLEKALQHQDEEVIKAAIDLLVRDGGCDCLKDQGSFLLNHPRTDVRIHSVKVIARLCGKECQPALEQRLKVENEAAVRLLIEETLQHMLRSGS